MKIANTDSTDVKLQKQISRDLKIKSHRQRRCYKFPKNAAYTVLDTGADRAYVGKGWQVVKSHGKLETTDTGLYAVVDAVTTVQDPTSGNRRSHVIRCNHVLWRGDERESLLPPDQILWFGHDVDLKAITFDGKQRILAGKHEIPLMWDGKQCFFQSTIPRKKDIKQLKLPMVVLTHPDGYNPEATPGMNHQMQKDNHDDSASIGTTEDDPLFESAQVINLSKRRRRRVFDNVTRHVWKPYQLVEWRKRLGNPSDEAIKKTFLATTQLAPGLKHENETFPKDFHIQRFPHLNVRRIKEQVYFDPVELPSEEGSKKKQHALLFTTEDSMVEAIYPLSTDHSAPAMLERVMEFIRDYGCPSTFRSDNASNLTKSEKFKRFSTKLLIHLKPCEAGKKNQNLVERKWQDIQSRGQRIIQEMVIPKQRHFDTYRHIVDMRNHTARADLDWRTPLETLTGDTPDISVIRFRMWEPVWYLKQNGVTAKQRKWVKGRFCGIAWSTGDNMCFEVQDESGKTAKLQRSIVLPRHVDENAPREILKMPSDHFFPTPVSENFDPVHPPSVGREPRKRGNRTVDGESNQNRSPKRHKSNEGTNKSTTQDSHKESLGQQSAETKTPDPNPMVPSTTPEEDQLRKQYMEEVMEHDKLLNDLSTPLADDTDIASVQSIRGYTKGKGDSGLRFNVRMYDGSTLNKVAFDDMKTDVPMMTAQYILSKKTLTGDKRFADAVNWAREQLKRSERLESLTAQIRRKYGVKIELPREMNDNTISHSRRTRTKCRRMKKGAPKKTGDGGTIKYGVYVPKDVKEALQVDEKNGNSLWRDAIKKELKVLMELGTFRIIKKSFKQAKASGYQYAPLRMIFTVKQNLTRKARLVVQGHVVDATGLETYASTMKTISAKALMCVAAANKMDVLVGDITNAYLHADTNEKIVVKLGTEFNIYDPNIKAGSAAEVVRAQYGLPCSGNRWHAHLSETLRGMGFVPSRFDPDIWIRYNKKYSLYDYSGTHTDDLLVVSKEAQVVMDMIMKVYPIKKVGKPDFHLGHDYLQDTDGTWYMGSITHTKEAIKKAAAILSSNGVPNGNSGLGMEKVPMRSTLKPELDDTEVLDDDGKRKYQQLMGIAQWLVTCGRLDINFAVCSLTRFSVQPRAGHMKAVKKLYGYLNKFPAKWIKIDPSSHRMPGEVNQVSPVEDPDWTQQYPYAKEEIDRGYPDAKGAAIEPVVYFDSNFAHDEVTRRSVTGIIGFLGNTPVVWTSKRQTAIATSTYSAELMAARNGAEEAISLRQMLRSLGVPIKGHNGRTPLIGDNLGSLQSVDNPGNEIKKRAVSVSWHYVRECNAAGIIRVLKIHTDFNYADIFTKSLDSDTLSGHLKGIFGKVK